MMFQQATLFPVAHRRSRTSCCRSRSATARRAARAKHDDARALLELVGLKGFADVYPERAVRRHGAARRHLPDADHRAGRAAARRAVQRARRADARLHEHGAADDLHGAQRDGVPGHALDRRSGHPVGRRLRDVAAPGPLRRGGDDRPAAAAHPRHDHRRRASARWSTASAAASTGEPSCERRRRASTERDRRPRRHGLDRARLADRPHPALGGDARACSSPSSRSGSSSASLGIVSPIILPSPRRDRARHRLRRAEPRSPATTC